MKKVFKNYEIENILGIMNDDRNFFRNTSVKLPAAFRHAMRINAKVLAARQDIYNEERSEIINEHKEKEHLFISPDGNITYAPGYKEKVFQEINELAMVDNELELDGITRNVADRVLDMDMSMAEEELIELFIIPE